MSDSTPTMIATETRRNAIRQVVSAWVDGPPNAVLTGGDPDLPVLNREARRAFRRDGGLHGPDENALGLRVAIGDMIVAKHSNPLRGIQSGDVLRIEGIGERLDVVKFDGTTNRSIHLSIPREYPSPDCFSYAYAVTLDDAAKMGADVYVLAPVGVEPSRMARCVETVSRCGGHAEVHWDHQSFGKRMCLDGLSWCNMTIGQAV